MKETNDVKNLITKLLRDKSLADTVNIINDIRQHIHSYSPFKNEPVDFVQWVQQNDVVANEYNPNKVAPPEMELLEISIINDGYTQPIVTWPRDDGMIEVVDGFHRNRVGKESKLVAKRIKGFLPTVAIRSEQNKKSDRIASTIRHNRARGKHQVNAMSDIVIELKNRNWTNKRIGKQLGMDEEEILRLCQITGLEELFKDGDFSKSWNAEDSEPEEPFEELTDTILDEEKESAGWRTVNTNDPERIFHQYKDWECYKAGFYNSTVDGMTKEECETECARFLASESEFRSALEGVISEWVKSCEHYLTNISMNRIAWLGQAALCYAKGIPSVFRAGYHQLSNEQQEKADAIALGYLNKWNAANGREEISLDAARTDKQVNIY